VFVVDHHGHPTVPRHPARERKVLTFGRVRSGHLTLAGGLVDRLVGCLMDREVASSVVTGVGVDPGFKLTGVSVFVATPTGGVGLAAIEVRTVASLSTRRCNSAQLTGWVSESRPQVLATRLDNRTKLEGAHPQSRPPGGHHFPISVGRVSPGWRVVRPLSLAALRWCIPALQRRLFVFAGLIPASDFMITYPVGIIISRRGAISVTVPIVTTSPSNFRAVMSMAT